MAVKETQGKQVSGQPDLADDHQRDLHTQRWKQRLSGVPELLQLPTDRPRTADRAYGLDRIPFQLPAEWVHSFRTVAQSHGLTPFQILLSGLAVVLGRWAGQDEFVIGATIWRRRSKLDSRVAEYIFPIPFCLRGDLTSEQLVSQVSTMFQELTAGPEISLQALGAALGLAPSSNWHPLYQVCMRLCDSLPSAEEGASSVPIRIARETSVCGGAPVDLTLLLSDGSESLIGVVEFASGLFSREMIGRLVGHWRVLLGAMVSDMRTPTRKLPLLSEAEREQLLQKLNDQERESPCERLVHESFERQVERTPDALAVVCEEHALTFSELNDRANRLAGRLRELGVGPDVLVGICLDRSAEALVGILGVLKAGGAYVPVDPNHPPAHIAYILNDAAPKAVVTSTRFERLLPDGLHCLSIDERRDDSTELDFTSRSRSSVEVTERHLAYVIYTSGSTGKPNGVMIEHRSVTNHWSVVDRIYRGQKDCRRIAINAPFTFDVSVQQYLLLLSGCTLFIVPERVRRDPQKCLEFFERHQIEGVDCTPSQLNVWVAAGLFERCGPILKTVIVGGEALDPALWVRLTQSSQMDFYNVYGPTECTVFSTAAYLRNASSIPHIGRPIDNARVYILDSERNPLPVGIIGEIYIGGPGVARGYLHRPELTAQRFTEDPFIGEPDARVYRTGDLARWRDDGTIEFVGRSDEQVKIRGYRIEPREVEDKILLCSEVSEVVVMAREDVPGEKRLVAYVLPRKGTELDVGKLRADTERLLPEYMVPSAFVVLNSWPLTANGKLDRRALPAPQLSSTAGQGSDAARGEIEEALETIWRDVLRVSKIGRHDKFLQLGGHSVQGMRLITRVAERFDIEMSFPDVFQHPTISKMAELVERRRMQRELARAQRSGASNGMESGSHT